MNRGAAIIRIRALIAQSQLQEAIGRIGGVPKSIADRLYKLRNERRIAEVVLVPVTAIKKVPAPTGAQLATFHKANAAKYRVPKLRRITALIVTPKDVDAQIKITSDLIRKTYDARKDDYSDPEKREAHQIIIKDEATAKKALAAIHKGGDFDQVAKDVAKASAQSLGLLSPAQIAGLPVAAMRERIPTLEKGQVAGPFKSAFGWHLIIIVDIVAPKLKPLVAVRAQIVEEIRRRARPKILARWRDRMDDDITAGDTLEAIAKALKIKATRIKAIDSRGNNGKGEKVTGLPQGRRFLTLAFDQKPGEIGDIVDTRSDGGFYVIRVDKETPARVTPLKDITNRVTGDWTRDERQNRAKALAAKVAAAMREGRSAEGAAKQFDLRRQTTRPLIRGASEASGISAPFIQNVVFQIKKGGVVVGRTETGWAVAKVTEILGPDEKTAKTERKKIVEALETSVGTAILIAFQKALDAKYPSNVDTKSIDELFSR